MKKTARILALVLALMMIVTCFIACGGKEDDPNVVSTTTVANNGGEGDASTTRDIYESHLTPTDWGGKAWNVLGRDSNQMTNYEIDADSLNGNVVNDAVFTRNEQIKTQYGIDVVGTIVSNPTSTADLLYSGGEDLYHAVLYIPRDMIKHAQRGFFLDLNTVENIDLAHGAWDWQANEELSINGKLYIANSDFLIQAKARTYFMMYNRELFHTHEEYVDVFIEDFVESGDWTLEKFYEISSSGFASDLDGGGAGGKNDQWVLCADGSNVTRNFAFGAGYRVCKNNDGILELVPVDDKTVSMVSEIMKVTREATMTLEPGMFQPLDYALGIDTFADGRSLFLSDLPSSFDLSLGSSIDFEYGILPYPKYDKEQPAYYTQFNYENGSCVGIPYTVSDVPFAGYALEAVTEASTKTSLEAFIETKCKLHHSYDQKCADMLDILYDNVVYDVGAMLNVGGAYSVIADVITYYPGNPLSRLYEKKVDAANTAIEEVNNNW